MTYPLGGHSSIQRALAIADCYGSIDGEHHKMWVIDQMVRALVAEDYENWVRQHKDGQDGPDTHRWDKGIAP